MRILYFSGLGYNEFSADAGICVDRLSGHLLDRIEAVVPKYLNGHPILNSQAAHETASIGLGLTKRPRYHVHFTATGPSWINLVERWFAALINKRLQRVAHRSTRAWETTIRDFLSR